MAQIKIITCYTRRLRSAPYYTVFPMRRYIECCHSFILITVNQSVIDGREDGHI